LRVCGRTKLRLIDLRPDVFIALPNPGDAINGIGRFAIDYAGRLGCVYGLLSPENSKR